MRPRMRVPAPEALLAAAALAMGCASAGVDDIERKVTGPLPRPPVLLVYDFAFDPADVDLDRWGLNVTRASAATEAQRKLGEYISRRFSDALVKELERRTIPARRAIATTPVPRDAIRLRGVFLSIKEGDEVARNLVGFGYGASAIEARIEVSQQSASGPLYLGAGGVVARGSRSPGTGLSSAAKQSVRGLVFKAGASAGSQLGLDENLPTALKDGIKADVERAAKAVADRVEQGYRKQGWL